VLYCTNVIQLCHHYNFKILFTLIAYRSQHCLSGREDKVQKLNETMCLASTLWCATYLNSQTVTRHQQNKQNDKKDKGWWTVISHKLVYYYRDSLKGSVITWNIF
jgi:hypothetical protein